MKVLVGAARGLSNQTLYSLQNFIKSLFICKVPVYHHLDLTLTITSPQLEFVYAYRREVLFYKMHGAVQMKSLTGEVRMAAHMWTIYASLKSTRSV